MSRSMLLKYLDKKIYTKDMLNFFDLNYEEISDIKMSLEKISGVLEGTKVVENFVSMKVVDLRYIESLSGTEIRCIHNILDCIKENKYIDAYKQLYICLENSGEGHRSDRFININEYYMIKFLVEIFIREIEDSLIIKNLKDQLKVI